MFCNGNAVLNGPRVHLYKQHGSVNHYVIVLTLERERDREREIGGLHSLHRKLPLFQNFTPHYISETWRGNYNYLLYFELFLPGWQRDRFWTGYFSFLPSEKTPEWKKHLIEANWRLRLLTNKVPLICVWDTFKTSPHPSPHESVKLSINQIQTNRSATAFMHSNMHKYFKGRPILCIL